VVANPAEPVLPLELRNVTVAGNLLRGVGYRGGSYADLTNRLPLTGAPATELRGVHMTFPTESFYPHQFWSANFFGALIDPVNGQTQLTITPAQFIANAAGSDTGTLRTHTSSQFRLFYNNNTSSLASGAIPALAGNPTISRVTSTAFGTIVGFDVVAFGEPNVGIQQVWITYTSTSGSLYGQWQSLDLTRSSTDDLLWQGSLTLPSGVNVSDLRFFVQAANQVGLVALDTNEGSYFRIGEDPGAPVTTNPLTTFLTLDPATARYGESTTLTAQLSLGFASALAGQPVTFTLGSVTRLAFTNGAGVAQVVMPAQLDPGEYQAYVNYGGNSVFQAAQASSAITIARQNSTLNLMVPAQVGLGDLSSVLATLTGQNGQPIVGESVAMIVSGTNGSYSAVLTTDIAGQVDLGLIPLPAGSYTLNAYFAGTIPAPISATYTSPFFQPASSQAALTLVTVADTIAPLTSLGSVPGNPSSGPVASFRFGGRDNLTATANLRFECSLDGAPFAACSSPQIYTTLLNGSHTFQVRALDSQGNADPSPASYTWEVINSNVVADTIAPSSAATVTPTPNSAGWNNGPVTVQWNWSDNQGGVGIDSNACTTSTSSSGEGIQTLTASCTDLAGNSAQASQVVRIDSIAPTTAASATRSGTQATVTLTASDTGSGVAATSYRINGGPSQSYSGPFVLSGTGNYTITFASSDVAGNVEATRSFSISIVVFPTSPIRDTFNRANGALRSQWAGSTSTSSYRIVSNRVDVNNGGPIFWKPSFGVNQEAYVTLSVVPQSCAMGLTLKAQANSYLDAGAINVLYDARNQKIWVQTIRTGSPLVRLYTAQSASFASGDQLGARALANGTVEVYKNGVLIATFTLNTSDRNYFATRGGSTGLVFLDASEAFFDDFGAGTIIP
jgi:hypothetical protein